MKIFKALTEFKRKFLILFGLVLATVVAVVIAFTILWGLQPVESPIRLLDVDDFRQEISDNLSENYELIQHEINSDNWLPLGSGLGAEDSEFWIAPLPPSIKIPSLVSYSPSGLKGTMDGRSIAVAANFDDALHRAEQVIFPSRNQIIEIHTDVNKPGKISSLIRTYFSAGTLTVTAKANFIRLTRDEARNPRLDIEIDGKSIKQFVMPIHNRKFVDVDQFSVNINVTPGVHRITLRLRNNSYDPVIRKGLSVFIKNIELKPLVDGIIYKQPAGREKTEHPGNMKLELRYPGKRILKNYEMASYMASQATRSFVSYRDPVFLMKMNRSSATSALLRSVLLNSHCSAKAAVKLPADPQLKFFYGFFNNTPAMPATFNIIINKNDEEGGESFPIPLHSIFPDRWNEAKLDISRFSGQKVTISFEYLSGNNENSAVIIGEPIIYSRRKQNTSRPNILLIVLDTLRADHLGINGYGRKTSPNLDEIARQGVNFAHAYAHSCNTGNSHQSILSGMYPISHSNLDMTVRRTVMSPRIPSLATHLKLAGYRTVAFTGGLIMNGFRFSQGFDYFEEENELAKSIEIEGTQRLVSVIGFEKAYDWLQSEANTSPFFMLLHTYAVHEPYAAPPQYDNAYKSGSSDEVQTAVRGGDLQKLVTELALTGTYDKSKLESYIAAYDRCIRYTDDNIAVLFDHLKQLNLLDDTIVIITADHGEQFLEHGGVGHNRLYDELLHVPLIIRYPKILPAGKKIEDNVQSVDIVPTILDLLDIDTEFSLHGKSLLPLIKEGQTLGNRISFAQLFGWWAIRSDSYKYILNDDLTEELYMFNEDPVEQRNLLEHEQSDGDDYDYIREKFLLTLSDSLPGWNLLIKNKPANEGLGIKTKGLKINDTIFSTGGYQYGKEIKNLSIFVGRSSRKARTLPMLMNFFGTFEKEFIIRLTPDENQDQINMGSILLGGKNINKFTNVIRINPQNKQFFSSTEQLRDIKLPDEVTIILKNNNPLMNIEDWLSSENMSSEFENTLRNLGYIQ